MEKEIDVKKMELIPPMDLEIEKVVLGTFIMEKAAQMHLTELNEDLFYSKEHKIVCSGICSLSSKGKPIEACIS